MRLERSSGLYFAAGHAIAIKGIPWEGSLWNDCAFGLDAARSKACLPYLRKEEASHRLSIKDLDAWPEAYHSLSNSTLLR
jgi:hypothetical protein